MENNKFSITFAIPNMDETTIVQARHLFLGYLKNDVIKSSSFDDDIWFTTDEYSNVNFDFRIKPKDYQYSEYLHISIEDFLKYLKTYTICHFGEYALGSLRSTLHSVKQIVTAPVSEINKIMESINSNNIDRIGDFFSMLPLDGREKAINDLLDIISDAYEKELYSDNRQRTLAAFESYFRFNDILKRFWAESEDLEERLFFFPVWLWWNLTAILPLRPRVFIVTPRNCLKKYGDEYRLVVRRNNIKGSSKTKSYKISQDYKINEYNIPEALAKEIEWYIKVTEKYMDNDIHTLLIADPHYMAWERTRPNNSRYFTYMNLRTCLRYFYNEIVMKRYGYNIIYDTELSTLQSERDINYLHLGDTRHLALINLILEGATPMVAMALAGHDNPDMSSHYYSNITKLVECRTYRQYKKMLSGQTAYKLSGPTAHMSVRDFTLLSDGSRCYSSKYKNGDFSDCRKSCGPCGELGFCGTCSYHREKDLNFHDSRELYENRIMNECNNLQEVVRAVRAGKGEPEEITQALMKLKDQEYSYQQYLLETMEDKE